MSMAALNPFVWGRPIDDTSKIVGMDAFAGEMALMLKAQTNVVLFGPRDTGKTTFTTQLTHELSRSHGQDAPPHEVVRINLQRAMSIPAFCACVHDALSAHPEKALRREARRQMQVMEKEIGFDIRVVKGNVPALGGHARAGRRVAARAARLARAPERAPRRDLRRVPDAPSLPQSTAVDHPLGVDEQRCQQRYVADDREHS